MLAGGRAVAATVASGLTRTQVLRLLAAVGVAVPLGGCAGRRSEDGASVRVAVGARPASLRISVDGESAKFGLGSYKERSPHIAVALEEQVNTPGGQNWRQKAFAEWMAGQGPDLIGACCGQLPEWDHQRLFTNLDGLIKRDAAQVPLQDCGENLLATWSTPEHGQYALPSRAGVMALYYSRALFRREGLPIPDATWDWSRWQQVTQRFNRPDQGLWSWYVQLNFQRAAPFLRQNGGFQIDPRDATKVARDSPASLQALTWLHDRMWVDGSLVKQGDLTQLGVAGGSPWLAVSAGKLAMLLDGSWSLASWARSEPQAADQWDVAVLPRGPVGRSAYHSSDGWAIWRGGQQQDAAWELLKYVYLQSREWVELAAQQGARVPARKSMQDSFATLVKQGFPPLADKNLAAFTDPIKQGYAHSEQFFAANDTEAKMVWQEALNSVFVLNERAVADTFRAAARKATEIVASK